MALKPTAIVVLDESPVKASPMVPVNMTIGTAPSPARKRLHTGEASRMQCPLCFCTFSCEEIIEHAASCAGAGIGAVASSAGDAASSSAGEQEPGAKRQCIEKDNTTVFSLAMQLTQQLGHSDVAETVSKRSQAPAGKARCPVCWRLFAAGKIDSHAAECDGEKRLKTADRFIKAYEPMQSIVNFDSAVAFLSRLRTDIQKFGDKTEWSVVFHWTPEANHTKIEDSNFYVPKPWQVANANAYGTGIYAADSFGGTRAYGKGAEKCILCVANAGRVYDNDVSGHKDSQQHGYDSACFWNKQGHVFFSVDQVLPCFLVSKDDYKSAEQRLDRALPELMEALSAIAGAEHDSDNRIMLTKKHAPLQHWFGWLRSLVGLP